MIRCYVLAWMQEELTLVKATVVDHWCEFNGTWFLEGVTSWGYRCAYASKYGVYAKVRDLKAWLTNHIYQAIPPAVSPQNQSVSALGKYSKQFL